MVRAASMKSDVKQEILATGAGIVLEKGFNHTGIQEILKASGVPKGSFYFYFKSKEAYGIELVDFYNRHILKKIHASIDKKGACSAFEKLKYFFRYAFETLAANDYKGGCPIGNLSLEMADINERFRVKLKDTINQTKQQIADLLILAKEENDLDANADVHALSQFLFSSWEGTLMLMKVMKSTEPEDAFYDMVFNRVLNGNLMQRNVNDG